MEKEMAAQVVLCPLTQDDKDVENGGGSTQVPEEDRWSGRGTCG